MECSTSCKRCRMCSTSGWRISASRKNGPSLRSGRLGLLPPALLFDAAPEEPAARQQHSEHREYDQIIEERRPERGRQVNQPPETTDDRHDAQKSRQKRRLYDQIAQKERTESQKDQRQSCNLIVDLDEQQRQCLQLARIEHR